ncbi:MAG: hypothetical protein O3A46_17110, partial [Candidatus Poribacteria bacterium]|nr:hypothetical protein [Candidatus Poribacteria bacterium]
MRIQLPLAICFFVGVTMLIQYFVPHDGSQELFRRVVAWNNAMGVFAFVLSIGSLMSLHARKIGRRSENWQYSIVVVVSLVVMAGVGLIEGNLQPAKRLIPTQTNSYETGTYSLKNEMLTLRAP